LGISGPFVGISWVQRWLIIRFQCRKRIKYQTFQKLTQDFWGTQKIKAIALIFLPFLAKNEGFGFELGMKAGTELSILSIISPINSFRIPSYSSLKLESGENHFLISGASG
jgi:hypothetical protein